MDKVTDIRNEFEAIIQSNAKAYADFIADNKALNEKMPGAVESDHFMPDYLRESYEKGLQKLIDSYTARAAEDNKQLMQHTARIKEKYINPLAISAKKDPDYAAKVNNAIQFIIAEGESITDSAARNILSDFIYDYDTMRRFEKLITKQIGRSAVDPRGNTIFPETFGHMQKVDKIMEIFGEIEDITAVLFKREIRMFPDADNSAGGIACKIGNPVRLTEDMQKSRLLDIAFEIEPLLTNVNRAKTDDYSRLSAESRFVPAEA